MVVAVVPVVVVVVVDVASLRPSVFTLEKPSNAMDAVKQPIRNSLFFFMMQNFNLWRRTKQYAGRHFPMKSQKSTGGKIKKVSKTVLNCRRRETTTVMGKFGSSVELLRSEIG
jgi:hypothetical protein